MSRRAFLKQTAGGLGLMALGGLLGGRAHADGGALSALHHAPKAKRIIYLFQSGAPSQMDLFDPKPALRIVAAKICQRPSGRANA